MQKRVVITMDTIFLVLQKPKYSDSAWVIDNAFTNMVDANWYAQRREEVCNEIRKEFKFRVMGIDVMSNLDNIQKILNKDIPSCEVMVEL